MSYAHPTCQFFGRQRARSLKSLARFPVRLFSKAFQGLAKPSHAPLTSQKGSARMFWFVELHGGRLAALLSAFFLTALSFASYAAPHADVRSVLEHKPRPSIQAADLAKQIHARTNEERAKHGLSSLAWDEALSRIAARHSRDMATRKYLGHDSPRGRVLRYRRVGLYLPHPRQPHHLRRGRKHRAQPPIQLGYDGERCRVLRLEFIRENRGKSTRRMDEKPRAPEKHPHAPLEARRHRGRDQRRR